jgi:hypothetical protein
MEITSMSNERRKRKCNLCAGVGYQKYMPGQWLCVKCMQEVLTWCKERVKR